MAIKTKLTVEYQSYEGTLTNNPTDADKISKYVEETSVIEVYRNKVSISNGATNQAIAVPSGAADYLVIFTDQVISIKLNSSATALSLYPRVSTEKCPVFVLKGAITALTITNASGYAANVDIIMAVL